MLLGGNHMELSLKVILERPFVMGLKTLADSKTLKSETAYKVGRIWKKLQHEATEWEKTVDAKREEATKALGPDATGGAKQTALTELQKEFDAQLDTMKIEVKVSPIDFKEVEGAGLTGEQMVCLEPIFKNLPDPEAADPAA